MIRDCWGDFGPPPGETMWYVDHPTSGIVRLADAGLLIMDRAKSDRDYERELRRRAHSIPSLIDAFSGNVVMFQSTWYGMHGTSGEMVELFQENYRRIAAYER